MASEIKIWANGCIWYMTNKILHRIDGPAVIDHHVDHWYFNGERHREDGPAVQHKNMLLDDPDEYFWFDIDCTEDKDLFDKIDGLTPADKVLLTLKYR